jgi:hypothetical protein
VSLILVTAANAPYMERIAPYLHSIQAFAWSFDRRVLVTVGCRVDMPSELEDIEAVPLPASQAVGHTGNWCIQQGCFLDVLGASDDDVLVFTDGDIVLQRPPVDDELAWKQPCWMHQFPVWPTACEAGSGTASMSSSSDGMSTRQPTVTSTRRSNDQAKAWMLCR